MDLNLLKTFDAVMKSNSVNQAAEVLNISSPAVSHALNRLREVYQDPLFIRQGRGIAPTNFALELHSEIQEPLSLLLNGAKSRQEFCPELSQRTFRISSHKDIDLIIVPAMSIYKIETAPMISIQAGIEHINEEDRQNDLRRRRVDVILATVPLSDRGYHNELLFEQELVVTVSKDHPRIQTSISTEEFLLEQHIIWKTQRLNTHALDSVIVEQQLAMRKVAYSTSSTLTGIQLASKTDWVCVTGKWHAANLADKLGCNILPLPFKAIRIPIYMTWHQSQKNDKGHQWLRESLKEVCKQFS